MQAYPRRSRNGAGPFAGAQAQSFGRINPRFTGPSYFGPAGGGYRAAPRASVRARGMVNRLRLDMATKKGVDTDISLAPVIATTSTNASSFVLNLVQAGTGSWNRVGRKIQVKSVRLVGTYEFNFTPTFATGAGTANGVRCVVVWDKQPSGGAIPTFETIFGITAQDGTESCPDTTCPPRYDNMDRFKVVFDQFTEHDPLFVTSTGTAPSTALPKHFDYFIPLQKKCGETVFSGQSAPMTIADISTGALYVYFRSQWNQASTTVEVDGIARLRYLD